MRAALFLLILSLSATAAEKSTRTCRILFIAAPESALTTLYLFDGKTAQEVELTRMGFSPIYKISPEAVSLALLPTAPPTPATSAAAVVPAGAPAAGIAASIRDFYLIVSSDPANQVAPVKMQVVDADAANFKPGQMLWFNLTQNKVGGIVGRQRGLLGSGDRVHQPRQLGLPSLRPVGAGWGLHPHDLRLLGPVGVDLHSTDDHNWPIVSVRPDVNIAAL